MSDQHHLINSQVEPSGSGLPGWWLMARRELFDLWLGGRAFIFLILFSILLGVMSFLLATDIELRLIPPKEMVFLTLQITIAVGLFISVILAADSISSEREASTFEWLLLTPISRRQIVVGKFLAAVSPWPVTLAIALPYLAMLASNGEVLVQTLLWGTLIGSLLVVAFTGLGLLMSIWSDSNKSSLSLSLVICVIFLAPTQFPATAKSAGLGKLIQIVNPMDAGNFFLTQVLVSNRSPETMNTWLVAPVVFAALILGLLFLYAGPGLRLEGGVAGMFRRSLGSVSGLLVLTGLMGFQAISPVKTLQAAANTEEESPVRITINMDYKTARFGDKFEFSTFVTYNGKQESSPMVVALNIVSLKAETVDPEDWSPERSQYIKPMTSGQSIKHTWTIHAIVEGDYMIYLVVIPEPDGQGAASQPVPSSGIHLTVTPFTRLNPGGVLPLAVAMPIGLTLCMSFLRWFRRRKIDIDEA